MIEDEAMEAYLKAQAGEEKLRPQLDALGARYFARKPEAKVRKLWPMLAAVAAVGLLLLLALPGLFAPASAQYADFSAHQPLSLTERSAENGEALAAESSFNAGEFNTAIPNLLKYLENNPDDQHARLALGIAYLETDSYEAAKENFQRIAEADSELADFGHWYLALTALKQGDQEAIDPHLKAISADNRYLQKRIAELRAEL